MKIASTVVLVHSVIVTLLALVHFYLWLFTGTGIPTAATDPATIFLMLPMISWMVFAMTKIPG